MGHSWPYLYFAPSVENGPSNDVLNMFTLVFDIVSKVKR
jgi:hypothetical protein